MENLLEEFISQKDVYYHQNIVPGHTPFQVNWKWTLLLAPFHQVISKRIEYYFFYFERDGIKLYQYENNHFFGSVVFIAWSDISHFYYSLKKREVRLSFVFKGEKFCMMLNRMIKGQPWVEQNINYLLDNYFFADEKSMK